MIAMIEYADLTDDLFAHMYCFSVNADKVLIEYESDPPANYIQLLVYSDIAELLQTDEWRQPLEVI